MLGSGRPGPSAAEVVFSVSGGLSMLSDRFRNLSVPLSKLAPGKLNPRRVKPEREAHKKLVASIRAHGLMEPLIVRATSEGEGYVIIAGNRRYAALREVHKGKEDPRIACRLREADEQVAASLSLAENFAREPMHVLDEAEAFASLAVNEGKGVDAIAAEFGTTPHYIRQRTKLAALAPAVKAIYREGKIDTATAEVFSSLPEAQQEKVLHEFGDNLRHVQQLRNYLGHEWIDAKHALFDLATVPEGSVSTDLFSDVVRVERSAFMEAQSKALAKEKASLTEEGWSHVEIGPREALYGPMASMSEADREFDPKTARKLGKLAERRAKLEAIEVEEGDEEAAEKIGHKLDTLVQAEESIVEKAPVFYSEATKAVGTVFLLLSSDGSVNREYRVPRTRHTPSSSSGAGGHGGAVSEEIAPPTSADLSDRQKSAVFTHQTLAVREALLGNDMARKRVLALLLHDKVRSEALAIRPDANGVTLEATRAEGFTSPVFDRLADKRKKLDPLVDVAHVEDGEAYKQISVLSKGKLDALIDVLIVDALTCHALRPTVLVQTLANELEVDFRRDWRPDAKWLASFQKAQLSHLMGELYGPVYDAAREKRKKSELVEVLAKLFADAAEGTLEDAKLSDRVNRWLPASLRTAANTGD